MTSVADPAMPRGPAREAAAAPAAGTRDIRLDFFRGLAMFIILIAHTPNNFFTSWIPARFGFSDATEIFVFCSGMASAIAFGRKAFEPRGLAAGHGAGGLSRLAGLLGASGAVLCRGHAARGGRPFRRFRQGLYRHAQPVEVLCRSGAATGRAVHPHLCAQLFRHPADVSGDPRDDAHDGGACPRECLGDVRRDGGDLALRAARGARSLGLMHLHLGFPAEPWSDRKWFFNPFGWQLGVLHRLCPDARLDSETAGECGADRRWRWRW